MFSLEKPVGSDLDFVGIFAAGFRTGLRRKNYMLLQEESLDIITEFLLQFGYHKVKGIPLDTIQKLARIVITENMFIYEKKFY